MIGCRQGSLLSFGLLISFSSFVVARSNSQIPSDCFQGPDYWCLNQTTEALCHFTNKTIGVCGYSNKRCQIKTGNIYGLSVVARTTSSSIAFRWWVLQNLENWLRRITIGIQWRSDWSRWRSIFLLHAQSLLATVELSTNLQWHHWFSTFLLFTLHWSRPAWKRTISPAWSLADICYGWRLSRLVTILHGEQNGLVEMSRWWESLSVGECDEEWFHSRWLRVLSRCRRNRSMCGQRQCRSASSTGEIESLSAWLSESQKSLHQSWMDQTRLENNVRKTDLHIYFDRFLLFINLQQ